MWGTTAISDEFTGNFGSAFEDTSIGDFCSVALFAEKSLQAMFGVLQHNPPQAEIVTATRSYAQRNVAMCHERAQHRYGTASPRRGYRGGRPLTIRDHLS
jgi:hypothetical protein